MGTLLHHLRMREEEKEDLLPQHEVLENYYYIPETGKIYHLDGEEEFNFLSNSGYLYGEVGGRIFYAHRVAWFLSHKKWPNKIDHINHSRVDNRLENLRSVSHKENTRNAKMSKANTSGVTGICLSKKDNRWVARIGGKYLGSYKTKEQASSVRKQAEKELGYHENHGRDVI